MHASLHEVWRCACVVEVIRQMGWSGPRFGRVRLPEEDVLRLRPESLVVTPMGVIPSLEASMLFSSVSFPDML